MLQMVLQEGNFGLFTQIALVLFFLCFLAILLLTMTRPRGLIERDARMPLNDDYQPEPLNPRSQISGTEVHNNE